MKAIALVMGIVLSCNVFGQEFITDYKISDVYESLTRDTSFNNDSFNYIFVVDSLIERTLVVNQVAGSTFHKVEVVDTSYRQLPADEVCFNLSDGLENASRLEQHSAVRIVIIDRNFWSLNDIKNTNGNEQSIVVSYIEVKENLILFKTYSIKYESTSE